MDVNISDYGEANGKNFVVYNVSGLSNDQIAFLHSKLEEETRVDEDILVITMYFEPELYPFQSDVAKFRIDDFISREEIEMNVFLSSFLEDMG